MVKSNIILVAVTKEAEMAMNAHKYDFPVYTTPFGGLVNSQRTDDGEGWENIFLVPSTDGKFQPGDKLPAEIDFEDLVPANEGARERRQEAREFQEGLDEFFDFAFKKVEEGKLSPDFLEKILQSMEKGNS